MRGGAESYGLTVKEGVVLPQYAPSPSMSCARTRTAAPQHMHTRSSQGSHGPRTSFLPFQGDTCLVLILENSSHAPLADDDNNTLLNQLLLHDTPFGLSTPHTSSSFNNRNPLTLTTLTMKFTSTLAVVFAVCTYVAAIPLAQDPSKSEHIDGQSAQADDSTRPYSDCQ